MRPRETGVKHFLAYDEKKSALPLPPPHPYIARMGESDLVGDRLRAAREDAGLSQDRLAEQAGVSLRQIQNIELGRTNSSVDTLRRLAAVLRIPVALLIDEPAIRTVESADHHENRITSSTGRGATDPPTSMHAVFDFNAGLREVLIVAEVSCGSGNIEPLLDDETAFVPEEVVPDPDRGEVLLRARGDSMEEWGIRDGDYLTVEMRRGGVAASGEVVIALLNGGITCKRYFRRSGSVYLQAGRPGFPSYTVTAEDQFEIQGIVRKRLSIEAYPVISGRK